MELISNETLMFHSPSRARGISYQEELKLRKDSCLFISTMGQTCKMGQLAIATASYYFHTFFAKLDFRTKDKYGKTYGYDRHEVAACCLFLAGKVEEHPKRVSDIVYAYYLTLAKGNKERVPRKESREFDYIRQQIEKLERVLLNVVEFNFIIKHPYTILVNYFNLLLGPQYANKSEEWQKGMKRPGSPLQTAWFFVNDSLRSTACLQYPPDSIAVAVIFMSLQIKKLDIQMCPTLRQKQIAKWKAEGVPVQPERPWFEELFNKDRRDLDAINRLIRQVIKQPLEGAPAPGRQSAAHQSLVAGVHRRRQQQAGGAAQLSQQGEGGGTRAGSKRQREHEGASGDATSSGALHKLHKSQSMPVALGTGQHPPPPSFVPHHKNNSHPLNGNGHHLKPGGRPGLAPPGAKHANLHSRNPSVPPAAVPGLQRLPVGGNGTMLGRQASAPLSGTAAARGAMLGFVPASGLSQAGLAPSGGGVTKGTQSQPSLTSRGDTGSSGHSQPSLAPCGGPATGQSQPSQPGFSGTSQPSLAAAPPVGGGARQQQPACG